MLTADIHTPRLVLSCLGEEHATETYRGWMADSEVNQYLETRFAGGSIDSLRAYVAVMRDSAHSYFFGIFSRETGAHYGNIKLGPISLVHGSAAIGLVIGAKEAWGKGLASEAIATLSRWAFEELGLEKLTAGSYQRNTGSIRAFEKCGYRVEGTQRSQVRLADGSRDDVVLLGRTRDEQMGAQS
jgi:ribosomal-protein-alanine N-acetyltransferase